MRFSGFHPAIRRTRRDRVLFVSTAIFAVFLFLVLISVLKANATRVERPSEATLTPPPAALGTITLYAPERDIPAGSKISETGLKEVYWPRNQIPDGAIRDLAEVRAKFAKSRIPAGFPIIKTQLSSDILEQTIKLTPGLRAVTIEVDATAGLEGHALPGTRVDVILTHLKEEALTSKIIVQNARVLSYGGNYRPLSEAAAAPTRVVSPKSTITLEVSQQDALKVQTARQMGRLSLIMRALEDDNGVRVEELDAYDVDGNSRTKGNQRATNCINKGRIRSGGKEFIVDCQGTLHEVQDINEP